MTEMNDLQRNIVQLFMHIQRFKQKLKRRIWVQRTDAKTKYFSTSSILRCIQSSFLSFKTSQRHLSL